MLYDPHGRLESSYPSGKPAALYCRHCQQRKYERNGGLICRTCDGPIHLLNIKAE